MSEFAEPLLAVALLTPLVGAMVLCLYRAAVAVLDYFDKRRTSR